MEVHFVYLQLGQAWAEGAAASALHGLFGALQLRTGPLQTMKSRILRPGITVVVRAF